ncbi:MAG: hypothetical protein ACIAXF_11560 [Phycisphaerales bacterium JB063]
MRHLRKLTLAALLLGFATLSTGCDRTTGALLVGGAIIGTALVLDAADDHDHHHHRHHNTYHHSSHHYDYGYGHGGHHGGYGHGGGYGYDYCD